MAEPDSPRAPDEKPVGVTAPATSDPEPSDAPTAPVTSVAAEADEAARAPSEPPTSAPPPPAPATDAERPAEAPVPEPLVPSDRVAASEPKAASEPPAPAPAAVSRSAPPPARESARPTSGFPSAPPGSGKRPGGSPLEAYEAVARSARLPDLVAVAQKVLAEAAMLRPSGWSFAGKASAAADDAKLTRADAETAFGNVLKILESGPEGEAERALASAIHAHAIAEGPRNDDDRVAADVLWLAAHSAFDATPLLDRALGEDADDLWVAIADRVKRAAEGRGASTGRGEAIVGCAALASSVSTRARELCVELSGRLADPVLLRMLATGPSPSTTTVRLEGELVAPPRSPVVTTLLAFTGILFAMHAVGLVARFALAYRRPTEVVLSPDGIRLKTRIEMLGRVLKEREHVIVRAGLVRVVREVRYPRVAFYAGLLALAIGSYIGVRAFADGVRAASPSLLVVGLVIIALGVAADFALGTLLPGVRGRCRIAFVPRTGATLAVGDVDTKRADDALTAALK